MAALDTINTANVGTNLDNAKPDKINAKLYVEAERGRFWAKFEGPENSAMPVIRKDDFSKEPLENLYINTLYSLTGSGVTGDSTLQGNEEALRLGRATLTVDWVRNAVPVEKRTKDKINFDWAREAAQPMLSRWLSKKMDDDIFEAFGSATTALYGGDASSNATIDSSDTLSASTLDRVKTYLIDNNAVPIRSNDGAEYFVMVVSPYDAYNLRQDTAWQNAQRDANVRGEENPLFSGAMGVYNGIIVYVNKGVTIVDNISKCIAFGGESIFRGYAKLPVFTEQLEDYGFKLGVGIEAVYGQTLNNLVNTNFAIVECYAANPNA